MSWISDLLGKGERFAESVRAQVRQQSVGPDTPSSDAASMVEKWKLISDVMEGHDAIKAGGAKYLPRFARESETKYSRRLADAPWRPIFPAAVESITARPFTKPVTLNGKASPEMEKFASDVDSLGNNLNVFARRIFDDGVVYGVTGIFVDFTRIVQRADGRPLTVAEIKEQGARPYWVQVQGQNLLDVRAEMVNGRTVYTHVRWREWATVYDGFAESSVEHVRVIELDQAGRPHWRLYQKQPGGDFEVVASGDLTGMTEIPFVLFVTGRKRGTFAVKPPLYDLAIVALEHYRAMARTTEIENFSGWPTLVGVGMAAPEPRKATDQRTGDHAEYQIEVGPGITLFAPGGEGKTDWKIIGPEAALVEQVAKSPERVMEEFRRLAMEPTIPRSNVTAAATHVDNSRAHSAIEGWAGGLKDALDQALRYAAMWLDQADIVTASVSTDFIALAGSTDEARAIADAQKRGVVSAKTERAELKRRGILGPDYSEAEEEQRLAEEQQGLEPEEDFDPVSGDVVPFERVAS